MKILNIGNQVVQDFINYVYSFYGSGGIYDLGATKADIAHATTVRILKWPELTFEGDSMDREHVRAVLEEQGFQGVAA
jgi:hypothetical protein